MSLRDITASIRVLLPIRHADRFLNALLGPRCDCGDRVFVRDQRHHDTQHDDDDQQRSP